jgi:hypothetical protein
LKNNNKALLPFTWKPSSIAEQEINKMNFEVINGIPLSTLKTSSLPQEEIYSHTFLMIYNISEKRRKGKASLVSILKDKILY